MPNPIVTPAEELGLLAEILRIRRIERQNGDQRARMFRYPVMGTGGLMPRENGVFASDVLQLREGNLSTIYNQLREQGVASGDLRDYVLNYRPRLVRRGMFRLRPNNALMDEGTSFICGPRQYYIRGEPGTNEDDGED